MKEKDSDSDVSNSTSSSPTDKLKPALNRTKARPSNHDPKPQSAFPFPDTLHTVEWRGKKLNIDAIFPTSTLSLTSYTFVLGLRVVPETSKWAG